jgi:hypothetical protein
MTAWGDISVSTGKSFKFKDKKFNKLDFKVLVAIGLFAVLFGFGLIRDLYTGNYKNYGNHKPVKLQSH